MGILAKGSITFYTSDENTEIIDNLKKSEAYLSILKENASIENYKWAIIATHLLLQSIVLKVISKNDKTVVLKKECKIGKLKASLDFNIDSKFIVTPHLALIRGDFDLNDINNFVKEINKNGSNVKNDDVIQKINSMYHLKELYTILNILKEQKFFSGKDEEEYRFCTLLNEIKNLTHLRNSFIHFHPWKQLFDKGSMKKAIVSGIELSIMIMQIGNKDFGTIKSEINMSLERQLEICKRFT